LSSNGKKESNFVKIKKDIALEIELSSIKQLVSFR